MCYNKTGGQKIKEDSMYLEKKRVVFLGLLLIVALPLLGVGCKKQEAAPSISQDSGEPVADANLPVVDSGLVIPEGWQVYRNLEDGYQMAYPSTWKVTADGSLYKDAPNLEQLLAESQGHFTSIAQVAPASIGVAVFDSQGRSVDQLWEERTARDPDTDRIVQIDGEYGRVGHCTGIRYYECLFILHAGQAYTVTMADQGLVWSDNPQLQREIEQIINTFHFLP